MATYDSSTGTVRLNWTAPSNDSYTYQVYRNNKFLAFLTETGYNDTVPQNLNAYQLVAVNVQGETQQDFAFIVFGQTICDPVALSVYWTPPFVGYHIRCECVPPWVSPCPPPVATKKAIFSAGH